MVILKMQMELVMLYKIANNSMVTAKDVTYTPDLTTNFLFTSRIIK